MSERVFLRVYHWINAVGKVDVPHHCEWVSPNHNYSFQQICKDATDTEVKKVDSTTLWGFQPDWESRINKCMYVCVHIH